jgi:ribosome maturation factor RimP
VVLEDRLVALIEPVAEAAGFELVRVRITGAQRKTLQVMAERPDKTMSAEDCAKLSRALSPVLEEHDPLAGAYTLEVSSPGIDRPLVRLKDFADWQGWPAKLELNRLVEGRKRFKGVLAGLDDGKIAFDIEGEETTALFDFDWIASAQLVLTDELIRETIKADKKKAGLGKSGPQKNAPEAEGDNAMETSR